MDTKNFLFVTVDAGGNIPPVIGLARRLSEKGHHVTILSEPCIENVILNNGLHFISFKEHFTRIDRKEDICKDWNAKGLSNPSFENIVFGPSEIVMKESLEALKTTQADVLVADCMLPAALMSAEFLNLPRVVLFHMPEYFPGPNRPPGVMGLLPAKNTFEKLRDRLLGKVFHLVLNKYLPLLNKIREQYQMKPLKNVSDLIHDSDLRLIQTSEKFDFPIQPAPKNVRYIGPVLDDPDWVSKWENPWKADDEKPLIVVSFSSTFQNQMEIIQKCIDAMKGLPVRGLVTLGHAIDHEHFNTPENVLVVASAPHSQVLQLAKLVITHAGHGTVIRALSKGIPLICIPMGRDQNDNAAKVQFHGCGISLKLNAKSEKIKSVIEKILNDSSYYSQAKKMKSEILLSASSNLGIQELEQIASKTEKVLEFYGKQKS